MNVFHQISHTPPSRHTFIFWYQSYLDCDSRSHQEVMEGEKVERNSKSNQKDVSRWLERFLMRSWRHHSVAQNNCPAESAQQFENFPFRPPDWTRTVKTYKRKRDAFAHLHWEKLERNPNFLQCTIFSHKCSFSRNGDLDMQKGTIWVFNVQISSIIHRRGPQCYWPGALSPEAGQ